MKMSSTATSDRSGGFATAGLSVVHPAKPDKYHTQECAEIKPDSLHSGYNWFHRQAKKRVHVYLAALDNGKIVLTDSGRAYEFGRATESLCARIDVKHARFYSMVALYGTIGAGEAYMSGYWDCDDLVTLARIFARNLKRVQAMDSSAINLFRWADRVCSWIYQNSLSGSKLNISKHYDLGNDFFSLFLDNRMMYSSAVYSKCCTTLEQASENKLAQIGEKLELSESDHLLEIGSGWGGLAVYMAQTYGCKVTTTTISNQQYQYARHLVALAGLENQVTVLNLDYRKLEGTYDKLVSVEMIEAVGHGYLPEYFKACDRLLKPGGKMLLQAITMPEQRHRQALKQVDFIQKHIFPGGCLPSVEVILHHMGKHTQFQLRGLHDITHSYALTLAQWRKRFSAKLGEVKRQGFDDSFIRMWEFYLCYCQAGFLENSVGSSQLLFERS